MGNLFEMSDVGKDYKALAIEKIDKELKEFQGDKYGKAVYTYVANTLREFCGQSDVFAKTLYKTKRSLSDCISEIMKGCGSSISDIEVYRRAAKLYFPNSEVEFVMKISIIGDAPDEKYLSKETKSTEAKPKENKQGNKQEVSKKISKKISKKENDDVIQLSLF